MLSALQASFPRWPEIETAVAPIDHLRWKLAGAVQPSSSHIVAETGGQIVGVRVSLTSRFCLHSETFSGRFDADSAVRPEWRGRGVYSAITRFGYDAAAPALVFTSTGRPSLVKLDRGLGHRPFDNRLVSMVCDLSAPTPPVHSTAGCVINRIDGFDARVEDFWTRVAGQFDFIVAPSTDELNWRYCDVRGGIGNALQAEEGSEVVGFAALRVSRGKGCVAYLLALPERIDVARSLVRHAVAYFRDAGVSEVICGLPEHHPYGPTLIDEGFNRKRHTIPLTCRPGSGGLNLSLLKDPKAAVHLMLGDTDLA